VCGLFDVDAAKVGRRIGENIVSGMEELPRVVREKHVCMAILSVPVEAAQEVADRAVAAGVKAIWNFASTSIRVPESVFVRHEHISVGLAALSYRLSRADSPRKP
jgi:redox-sensing transcriptional repressor